MNILGMRGKCEQAHTERWVRRAFGPVGAARQKRNGPEAQYASGPPARRPFRGGPFGPSRRAGLQRLRGGRGLVPAEDQLY